jgi:hypothetical protein
MLSAGFMIAQPRELCSALAGVASYIMMLAKPSVNSRYYWNGKSNKSNIMTVKGRKIRNSDCEGKVRILMILRGLLNILMVLKGFTPCVGCLNSKGGILFSGSVSTKIPL